jgi:diguanylate cyclase (GGDEF)-like protein/PAS domain S-box-containing protein
MSFDEHELSREVLKALERVHLLDQALATMQVGVTITDADRGIVYVNPAEARMHGYTVDELLGEKATVFAPPEFARPIDRGDLCRVKTWKRETINVRKDGSTFPVELLSDVVTDSRGRPVGLVTICQDITERWARDPLTGLGNRALLQDRLGHALARSRRHPRRNVAVLFIDLDRFKVVNDSLGHLTGDRLLAAVARRLGENTREDETLARIGGDEFVVVLEEVPDAESVIAVAERLHEALRQPFRLEDQEIFVSASIGIAVGTGGERTAEDLLREADTAMYRAKTLGRAQTRVFDSSMGELVREQLEMANQLRSALERGEFLLHYQPILSAGSRQVVGVEALLRWLHPERGFLGPASFLEHAEELGLIVPMGRWVLREACTQAAGWRKRLGPRRSFTINVNVSPRELAHAGFVDGVFAILGETGLPPEVLFLEITEAVLIDDLLVIGGDLDRLRERGVRIAIDDFGTGYSSIRYLSQLSVDSLKIDRSFVAEVAGPAPRRDLVQSIVRLAGSLGVPLVAEGVESEEQARELVDLGCAFLQGNALGRPQSAETTLELLDRSLEAV